MNRSFLDLYAHNFIRVAVAVPRQKLASPVENSAEIGRMYLKASVQGAALVLFPELCVSGYSLDDLHQQDALLQAVLEGLKQLIDVTTSGNALLIVGAPVRLENRIYNSAVIIASGRVLGIVPKSYIPNYRKFYEKRQFAAARDAISDTILCLG